MADATPHSPTLRKEAERDARRRDANQDEV